MALLWAAGVIWTAVEVASPDPPKAEQVAEDAAENAAGNAAKAQLPPEEQEALNTLASWGH